MPELPEVQTVVDDLNKKIKGDSIADFWSDWPKAIKGKSLKEFRETINGRKILDVRRIGKNIFINLSGGKTLYIHLKMTGHLLIKSEIRNSKSESDAKKQNYFEDKVNQYVHHGWKLKNRRGKIKNMDFSDMRKFAKIVLDDAEKIKDLPEIKKLGIDAMDPELTFKKFAKILEKRKNKPIGLVLLEQELLAGIGNIYRSEILFDAGILPTKTVKELKIHDLKKILKSVKKILKKAIGMRGTSDSDYRDTSGAPGNFQKILKVYGRTGKKCLKCDTIIANGKIGQRTFFYCPRCQR